MLTMNINLENLTQEQFDKLFNLVNDIKVENESDNGIWKPKLNEIYWYINSFTNIRNSKYGCSETDELRFKIGNCFKTEEDAVKEVKHRLICQELRELAGNKVTISSFKDLDKQKYYIAYNFSTERIYVTSAFGIHANEIYFSSEEAARSAIETIGEERLKREYFGIEE